MFSLPTPFSHSSLPSIEYVDLKGIGSDYFWERVLEVLSLEERELVNVKLHRPFIHLHSLSLSLPLSSVNLPAKRAE